MRISILSSSLVTWESCSCQWCSPNPPEKYSIEYCTVYINVVCKKCIITNQTVELNLVRTILQYDQYNPHFKITFSISNINVKSIHIYDILEHKIHWFFFLSGWLSNLSIVYGGKQRQGDREPFNLINFETKIDLPCVHWEPTISFFYFCSTELVPSVIFRLQASSKLGAWQTGRLVRDTCRGNWNTQLCGTVVHSVG